MKKFTTLMLVLILLAVTVTPALAAGNPPPGKGGGGSGKGGKAPFALAGTIASLDPAAGTITVTVVCGNKLTRPYIGQSLTIQTNAATRFLLRNADGVATPITFADLVVGQKVSINGQFGNNVWTASRVTVGADLTCQP